MEKYLEEPTNPGKDDGRCALCKKEGVTEENRCHGCGYLICEDCYGTDPPFGRHLVIEHEDD